MKFFRKTLLLVACTTMLAATASNSLAAIHTLNSGNFRGTLVGEGNGRGLSIHADSSFSIDSLGIFGNLNALSFTAEIYSSTNGSDVGALLASSAANLGGTGNGWNDIAINFSFNAGQFYLLHWKPTVQNTNNWAITLDYYYDSSLPLAVGPVTLINGEEGYNPPVNFGNTLHPNLRINEVTGGGTVPEPTSLIVWGLLGMVGLKRRKRC